MTTKQRFVPPKSWQGCRCVCAPGFCDQAPNYEGPSGGALCSCCDGSTGRLPHVAAPRDWQPTNQLGRRRG